MDNFIELIVATWYIDHPSPQNGMDAWPCGSVVEHWHHGSQFDSWSGHIARVVGLDPGRMRAEGSLSMILCHHLSVSLSLALPFSLKSIKADFLKTWLEHWRQTRKSVHLWASSLCQDFWGKTDWERDPGLLGSSLFAQWVPSDHSPSF